jgi:uncharacterized protein Yka (UPF0111/DUF47 family)
MPTIEEFGRKIKEKYPQYQNIDDAELGRKMLDKYPQYQSRVFSTDPQQQGELNKGGFINRAKETVQDVKEGFSNLKNRVLERSDRTNQLMNTDDSVFAKARNVFSQGVGFVGDVVGEGYKTAGKVLLSQEHEDKIAGGFESAVGKVLNTQSAQKLMGKYQELKQTRPEIAREIESALNLLDGFTSLSVGGAGAKQITKAGMKATKEGIDIVGDTAKLAKSIKTGGVETLDSVIDTGIEKAVRPSVAGKSSFKQLDQYKEKAREAVKTIVQHKDKIKLTDEVGEVVKGGLPQNLRQFSDAISQTKKAIYNKYTRLAKGAGKEATIDLKGVANSLKEVADNEIFQDLSPEIVKRAETLAASLTKRGTYTAEKAQSAIEALNNKLQSVYKNQSSINYSELLVDMMVANNLRKSVDELIENATGTAGYQKLKNLYGSLKTIEKDVAHRAMVDARKSPQGFFDISNIFTAGDLVQAVSNPAMLGKAAVQKGVLEYIKRINDPNRMIKKLFQTADKVLNNKFEPKSKLFNMAKDGKISAGMSIKDVSGDIYSEANKYKSAEAFVKADDILADYKKAGDESSAGASNVVDALNQHDDWVKVSVPADMVDFNRNKLFRLNLEHQNRIAKMRWDIKEGKKMRPIVVDKVYSNGKRGMYQEDAIFGLPLDGFHRLAAAREAGSKVDLYVPKSEYTKVKSQLTDIWNKENKKH